MKDYQVRQMFVALMGARNDDEATVLLNDFLADKDWRESFDALQRVLALTTGCLRQLLTTQGDGALEAFLAFVGRQAAEEAAADGNA